MTGAFGAEKSSKRPLGLALAILRATGIYGLSLPGAAMAKPEWEPNGLGR